MAWIKTVTHKDASGFLKKEYEKAMNRAGRIWNIVSVMSQNPRTLKGSLSFYGAIMHARSPLSRGQREMLAVVVSAENHCLY